MSADPFKDVREGDRSQMTRGDMSLVIDRLTAENARLREALRRVAEMEPIEPTANQDFGAGVYLPHGPVVGCARDALAAPSTETDAPKCLRVPPARCPDPSCEETGVCFETRRAQR